MISGLSSGLPGPLEKHDSVRIHRQNLLRRRTCRKVSHAASAPGQLADDIFLCAEIPEHNLELFFLIRRFDLTFLWCNGFNRLCNVEVFHFLQLFRIIRRLHLGQPAVHRTGFTNGFCQLSCINSIDAWNVSFFKKGVKIPTASEVGRFLTPLFLRYRLINIPLHSQSPAESLRSFRLTEMSERQSVQNSWDL